MSAYIDYRPSFNTFSGLLGLGIPSPDISGLSGYTETDWNACTWELDNAVQPKPTWGEVLAGFELYCQTESIGFPSTGYIFQHLATADFRFFLLLDGRNISIADNRILYNVLGTAFNDGTTGVGQFKLPDLREKLHLAPGTSRVLGAAGGLSTVTLSSAQVPALTAPLPTNLLKQGTGTNILNGLGLSLFPSPTQVGTQNVTTNGGGGAHENMPPFLTCGNWFVYKGRMIEDFRSL